ncbi:MAG: hypothetical protein Fur0032_21980 [Terrimicrobiaceae bacterium]
MFRIAANLCKDALRSRASERRKREAVEEGGGRAEGGGGSGMPDVEAALAALPNAERAAVLLVYYHGMGHAEAALSLGCAESTVSWRIFQVKRKLKKLPQQ